MDANIPSHLEILQRVAVVETKIDVKFDEISRRLDSLDTAIMDTAERSHSERAVLQERLDSMERLTSENKGAERVVIGGIALVVSGAVGAFFRWVGTI